MKSFPKTLDEALTTPWTDGPLFDDSPVFVSSIEEAERADRYSLPTIREARKEAQRLLASGTPFVDIVSVRRNEEDSYMATTRFSYDGGESIIEVEGESNV